MRPNADRTLADVMTIFCGNRMMNATELTVAIIKTGYETSMGRKALRDAVAAVLWKEKNRFVATSAWRKKPTQTRARNNGCDEKHGSPNQ